MDHSVEINNIQEAFEKEVRDGKIAYENLLKHMQSVQKVLTKDITTWPIMEIHSPIDVFYEALFLGYFLNDVSIPFELLVNLIAYKPMTYSLLAINMTWKEFKDFKAKIMEMMQSQYGSSLPPKVESLRSFIEISSVDEKALSSIQYFHGFVGFEYDDALVGINIPKSKISSMTSLMSSSGELKCPKNKIIINLGYNSGQDHTYVYSKQSIGFEKEFLTPEVIKMFKPIKALKLDRKGLYSGHIEDSNMIIFNYGEDMYTIPLHSGQVISLNKNETKRMLEGALPRYIPHKFFIQYSIADFNSEITKYLVAPSKEVKLPSSSVIINECRKVQASSLDEYIPKVMSKVKSKFNHEESLIFELYLKGFKGLFDKELMVKYIEEYFEDIVDPF